uniref:GG12189 n=1 Tax=Drosophila erecta TaxID=7220 RepID=B3P680_DROER
MNFSWLTIFILALIAMTVSAKSCPAPFKKEGAFASSGCPAGYNAENNRCTIERPVHGSCPPGSSYSLNINKCVHS